LSDRNGLDAWIHDVYGKHPASFQNPAGANDTAPQDAAGQAVPAAPAGLQRRKGDGAVLWEPAPLQTWGVSTPKPAPNQWVADQLAFFSLGPPDAIDPNGQTCLFNGATVTKTAVLDTLDKQATLAGWVLSRGAAQAAMDAMLKPRMDAMRTGLDLGSRPIGDDTRKALAALDMQKLLDALQAIRQQGGLDPFAKMEGDDRIVAAVLTVQHKIGERWENAMLALKPDERTIVETYLGARLLQDDRPAPANPLPDAQGATMPAERADDWTWVRDFLDFHHLQLNPLDMSGKTAILDGRSSRVDDIIDTVCEQAAAAGHADLQRRAVRDFVQGKVDAWALANMYAAAQKSGAHFSGAIRFDMSQLDTNVSPRDSRVSEAASVGVTDGMKHTDLDNHQQSQDNTTVQLSGQVTLEMHPDDGSGLEFTWVVQATGFKGDNAGSKKYNISLLSGPQLTWVQSFLDGLLKVEPFLQELDGALETFGTRPGKTLALQGQLAAGAQILCKLEGISKHLSIGLQATVGGTATSGQNPTFDRGAVGIIQWGS
jgi:hypothetical protein